MKKNVVAKPGDIIKIPLPDGTFIYARVLEDESYAIYDCKTETDIVDLEEIIKKTILFIASVDIFGLKRGYWSIVGNVPLADNLRNFIPTYFHPVPTDEKNIKFYKIHKNEIEEAIDKDWIGSNIQLGGVHGHLHIEERIMDHYSSNRHHHNTNAISLFKRMVGLPLNNF